ncbi:MAG TPA: histidine kinase [Flavisolibacter sp.]|nr:histidine kinase [Flavisolibacter sp.]
MRYFKLNRKEQFTNLSLISILVFIIGYLQFDQAYLHNVQVFVTVYCCNFLLTNIVVALLFQYMYYIRAKLPHYHQSLLRACILITSYVIITTTAMYLVFHTYEYLQFYDFTVDKTKLRWAMIIGVLFNVFYFVIFESFYIEKRWGDDVKEKEALRQANLVSQFESLKAQVNPHFLFNCLNSLSSLITQDPNKAEDFVDEMSNVYRYLLRNNEQGLVTIETEIQYIRSYFHLQKTRFGDAIALNIDIDDECWECLIPPLTLQMLLENAIKHNVLRKASPLRIEITGRDGFLSVRNNIQLKSKQYIISTKIGLANIASKYKLLNKSDILIYNDGIYFEVGLPLIENAAHFSMDYKI